MLDQTRTAERPAPTESPSATEVLPRQDLISSRAVDEAIKLLWARGREDFAIFRRLMHPKMCWGWWTQEVSEELQRFYVRLKLGRRPKLALMAPPQHGKTSAIIDFAAWVAGKEPDWPSIYASYSEGLGTRANRSLDRMMNTPRYRGVFPKVQLGQPGWQNNTTLIEYPLHIGSFRNTTVDGAINGFGLRLGLVDDPIKGRKEASSKQNRDAAWNWLVDDFMSRFTDDAGFIALMTRWHVDDPLGRLQAKYGADMRVRRYPAVAAAGRDGAPNWDDRREAGEALFPEFKSPDFLAERRKVLTEASWESIYQQSPFVVGGGQLPIEKFVHVPFLDRSKVVKSVRYFDKAGTAEADSNAAAYTAGCLMHEMTPDHHPGFVIQDMVRGRWSALDRENKIKATAGIDASLCPIYEIYVEQEPGSGGKESAESSVRNLAGVAAYPDRVTGDKIVRAEPFVAQVQNGNMGVIDGDWFYDYSEECESWPFGKFKDQVDASAGAFNKLTGDGDLSAWIKLGMQ